MNIIFLDIDGVLNSQETLRKGIRISNEHVLRLHKITTSIPDCKIVISSSWRVVHKLDEIIFVLWNAGLRNAHKTTIIGMTPVWKTEYEVKFNTGQQLTSSIVGAYSCRGEEIQAWISNFKSKELIKNYCIIDDTFDFLPNQQSRFIQTSNEIGLQDVQVEEAIKLLNS